MSEHNNADKRGRLLSVPPAAKCKIKWQERVLIGACAVSFVVFFTMAALVLLK